MFGFIKLLPRLEFLDPVGKLYFRLVLILESIALLYLTEFRSDKLPSLKKLEYRVSAKIQMKMALDGSINPPKQALILYNNMVMFLVMMSLISALGDILSEIIK